MWLCVGSNGRDRQSQRTDESHAGSSSQSTAGMCACRKYVGDARCSLGPKMLFSLALLSATSGLKDVRLLIILKLPAGKSFVGLGCPSERSLLLNQVRPREGVLVLPLWLCPAASCQKALAGLLLQLGFLPALGDSCLLCGFVSSFLFFFFSVLVPSGL